MRARFLILWVVVGACLGALTLGSAAHATATPVPISDPASLTASVSQLGAVLNYAPAPEMKKGTPKWACSRIYFEGKPSRPTAVKVWCNGGKSLFRLKTPGLKPGTKGGHSSHRDFKLKKGKYSNFTVIFRKQDSVLKGELRVFYMYGGKHSTFQGVVRNPWRDTPRQSRVL